MRKNGKRKKAMNEREFKQKHSSASEMKHTKKPLKNVELRLISELMKNSRRSDRELAKVLGISQPTVTRIRTRLEKEGYIKEYTMIPDFRRLGYTIMGATLLGLSESLSEEALKEVRKLTSKIEESNPHASLLAVNGLGVGKNRLFITFYENYADYVDAVKVTRLIPYVDVQSIESLLVDLNDETNYRVLSMSAIAKHLQKRLRSKVPNHE
jgi:DNA-binding Lrp family transcriptional regulator